MKIFVIAGEASGDALGEAILGAVKKRLPHCIIVGVGGPRMEKAGNFSSLFPFHQLSAMGLWKVLQGLPLFVRLLRKTRKYVVETAPDIVLTIDAPQFSLRISKWVGRHLRHIPRFHCVAPSFWAWRPGRARHMPIYTDHLLALFPFEKPFFPHMACSFVGHPVMESPVGQAERFHKKYPHLGHGPLLCLLPGSRSQEIRTLLPCFLQTFHILKKRCPALQAVVVTPPFLADLVKSFHPQMPVVVVENSHEKNDIFAAATVALAASGTVSLELARQGTPMVIGYRVRSRLGAWVLRRLLRIPHVALPNILAGKCVVPECLQEACTPHILAGHVETLLAQGVAYQRQKRQLEESLRAFYQCGSFGESCAALMCPTLCEETS